VVRVPPFHSPGVGTPHTFACRSGSHAISSLVPASGGASPVNSSTPVLSSPRFMVNCLRLMPVSS
jgi:hypothetical protein